MGLIMQLAHVQVSFPFQAEDPESLPEVGSQPVEIYQLTAIAGAGVGAVG